MALNIVMSAAAAPGGDPRTTSMASSASYTTDAGTVVSFTFNGSYPVGNYSDIGLPNHLFVVNTGGLSITNDSPTSQSVDGAVAYGMMKNPYVDESVAGAQGWDGLLDTTYQSARVAYDASLNIAPSLSGNSAITLASNEEATFTKAIRKPGLSTGAWQTFQSPDGYVHLHVFTAYPQNGSIPPAPSEAPSPGTPKKQLNLSDVDATVYRTFTLPSSWNSLNYADDFTAKIPLDLGYWGAGAQDRRRLRIDNDMPGGTTTTNYATQIANPYAKVLVMLHDVGKYSAAQRNIVEARALYFALCLWGVGERGFTQEIDYGGGAGQIPSTHPWLYYGAIMAQDADLLAAAQAHESALDAQCDWYDSSDLSATVPSSKNGWNYGFAHTEALGMPFVAGDSVSWSVNGRYNPLALKSSVRETIAISLLAAGTGSNTGVQAMLKGGALNSSNASAAHIAMTSVARHMSPWMSSGDEVGNEWFDLYDLMASTVGLTWTQAPYVMPNEESSALGELFSAGVSDGTITADVSSIDYSIETITQTDASYSLDGYQYIEVNNTTDSISLTGLLKNALHYCRYRRRSASGTGPWSANWIRRSDAGTPRGDVTTNGTANAAAPVTTVAPVILRKFAPNWWSDLDAYEVPSGNVDQGDILGCGVGYFDAAEGTPTSYSYQWKRNGSNIAGATNKKYTVQAADAGTTLTCERTATNASGSEVDTTAGVTVNA